MNLVVKGYFNVIYQTQKQKVDVVTHRCSPGRRVVRKKRIFRMHRKNQRRPMRSRWF